MHAETLDRFRHDHHAPEATDQRERRTRWVVVITAGMMVAELVVGTLTNSLALTADGWHMSTHAGALGLAALAYWFARSRGRSAAFSFGTGKVFALAGYTSAVVLALVAILMLAESTRRLMSPLPIQFAEALPVALLGLLVNLASVTLLHPGHDHGHGHGEGKARPGEHDHGHRGEHGGGSAHHHHHEEEEHAHAGGHGHGAAPHPKDARAARGQHVVDHNLRAAYLHVLADAVTSVLAIGALLGGRYLGWVFLDPLMGIVGAGIILQWGYGLSKGAARQLLDVVPSEALAGRIRSRLEDLDDVRVTDLHLWEVGPGRRSCIVSLVTSAPRAPEAYREVIRAIEPVEHVTVEVQTCPHEDVVPAA